MSKKILDKYIATILLHALGDTIGFKNGDWEFAGTSYGITIEKLCEFINFGGINDINLKDWFVSDDTILHMAIARSLIVQYNNFDDLENNTVKQLIKSTDLMNKNKQNGLDRYIGRTTEKHVELLKQNKNWKNFEYDPIGGGNGAAMRNNCIGLAFFGEENRSKLIRYSINSSKMTHVNPIGWLGGFSTALFTAYAIENIHIHNWIPKMLDLIEKNDVQIYLDKNNQSEMNSYEQFIQSWKTYYDSRFSNGEPTKTKSHTNLIQRLMFYNNIFDSNRLNQNGLSGCSAVIVAYDCLLDAENCWEKLVIYSMINSFDSDTIGAIAGGLYGTLYGMENIPHKNLENIEFKEKLIKIGNLLYKKYFLRDKIVPN